MTLQASNLTNEDLTLTVLAPASFSSPPSVMSLNSSPTSPMTPLARFPELAGRAGEGQRGSIVQRFSSAPLEKEGSDGGPRSNSLNEHMAAGFDVVPNADLGCSHLWLQSTVPLG